MKQTPEERINLINRVCQWVFDHLESWEVDATGAHLAYLVWAIADTNGGAFDTTLRPEKYNAFICLLRSNPDGLLDELIKHGYLHLEASCSV